MNRDRRSVAGNEYILRAPDGTVCDYVRSYAGLREISLRNGCILLNGKARYLRFVLDRDIIRTVL